MARYGVHEVADVTFYDLVSLKPVLYLNSLTMSDFETKASNSTATGGKGAQQILTWDFQRTVSFSMTNALLDPAALALQSGNALNTAVSSVRKREVLTVSGSHTATLSQTPIQTGALIAVYPTTDGITQGTEVTYIAGTATAGQYSISAKVVTFGDTTITQCIVYYDYAPTSTIQSAVTLTSNNFPGFYRMIGDTVVRNETTGVDEPYQIVVPKAKILPGFKLTLQPTGNPSTFDFNIEAFRDQTNANQMIQFLKY